VRQPDDKQSEIILKALFLAFVFALFILVPALFGNKSSANTSATAPAVSTQQELSLVILPALETMTIGESTDQVSSQYIEKTLLVGLRANTGWTLDYQASSNLSSEPSCISPDWSGERNLNNSMQTFSISCRQEISWGDQSGQAGMEIRYSVVPSLIG
jgi:hypothetical protein